MFVPGVDLLSVQVVPLCWVIAGRQHVLGNWQPMALCSSPEEFGWAGAVLPFLQQAMACLRFSPIFLVRMTSPFMLFTAASASPFDSG